MSKQLRVHALAKELGVKSKDIIQKCQAEGIELKNHMAAVSIGLAESIREWFSAGDDVTSVEVADPVDLESVRPQPATEAEREAEESRTATATVEADEDTESPEATEPEEAEAPVATAPTESEAPAAEPEPAAPEAAPAEGRPEEPTVEAPVEEEAEPPAEPLRPAATAESSESQEPEPGPPAEEERDVGPAGPQVVPKPAELSGPRVVRIEAPEPVRRPYSRPPAQRPAAQRPMPPVPDESAAPRKGGGPKKKGTPEKDAARGRPRSPRRRGPDIQERYREWRDQDILERKERLASATGHGLRERKRVEQQRRKAGTRPQPQRKTDVEITVPITIKDFCAAVGAPFPVISGKLMEQTGKMYTINQSLGAEEAELVAMDLGINLTYKEAKTALEELEEEFQQLERKNLQPRPPVVAMLGHVDHGKTSLLDAIRTTRVAAGEAGGITQHIGAYRINWSGWDVTFLDTPGHEAFTAMRARGATMTDVVVLVVAADDGVMPQTVEALNHAKAANVPIVVALNKIDLPGADLNKIYGQLAEHGLTPSEWGGETDVIKTSATSGEGIQEMLDHLSALSELMDLKADPDVPARGSVIEANMKEGRGASTMVLVREGTLKVGQAVVCGGGAGKVRSLMDDQNRRVKEARPGQPVEVIGLDELPQAGDTLYVLKDLSRAKQIAEEVRHKRHTASLQRSQKATTLEDVLRGGQEGQIPELNVIIRADGQGSVDAVRAKLEEIPADKARLNILLASVGAISEADVQLAKASGAIIVGLHVVADDRAKALADQVGVEIRLYRVIYEMIDDVYKALEGLLAPEEHAETRGKAEVRQVFNLTKRGTVAGCLAIDGTITRNCRVRLIRDGVVVVEGNEIESLKRFKDDVREVRSGLECGIKIAGYNDIKPGDVIEAYEIVEVAQRL